MIIFESAYAYTNMHMWNIDKQVTREKYMGVCEFYGKDVSGNGEPLLYEGRASVQKCGKNLQCTMYM